MASSITAKNNPVKKKSVRSTPAAQKGNGGGNLTGLGKSKRPKKDKNSKGKTMYGKEAIVQWAGLEFKCEANFVRGLKNLSLSADCDTEDKTTDDGEKYVGKKNGNRYEITLTAFLDERLGEKDVQETAINITEAARTGATGVFYSHGKKIFPAMFMATKAKISNMIIGPKGRWISCEVELTLKQASKLDGSAGNVVDTSDSSSDGSGGGGGGGGGSGGDGERGTGNTKYLVKRPDMGAFYIWANSIAEAIRTAFPGYTGIVLVDGVAYRLKDGVLTRNASPTADSGNNGNGAGADATGNAQNQSIVSKPNAGQGGGQNGTPANRVTQSTV